MAGGKGDGMISVRSIDGWSVPGTVKATMAFQIIWVTIGLAQLTYILKNLRALPMAARGPYILLAVVTFCLILYNLLAAIYTRVCFINLRAASNLAPASTFFWDVDAAFRPAVVLYLLHQRGDVLRAVKANTISPLSTYIWKRVLDWVMTGLAWVMYTGAMGATASRMTVFYRINYNPNNWYSLYYASRGLGQPGLALMLLLIINLVVSTIVQFIQGKDTKSGDLVLDRLLKVVAPLFIVYALESLIFDIYSEANSSGRYDANAFNLANVIIDGGLTVAITTALILTMTILGIHWTPETVVPEVVPPVPQKQWAAPNPGWNQPYAPNPSWSQPAYDPQPVPTTTQPTL